MSTGNFGDDPDFDTNKMKQKMNSLIRQQKNIDNLVWNSKSSYYLSQGDAGLKKLHDIMAKQINKDYAIRKKQYELMMNFLYNKYYDKLSFLYIQKTMTNKQIEIINNTQYKVLEQREVESNVTNELTTKNRERQYYDKLFRKQQNEVKLYSYLTLIFLVIIVIVLAMNYKKMSKGNIFSSILQVCYQNMYSQLIFVFVILFIIIVLKQFSLAILFLVIYAIITLLVDMPSNYNLIKMRDLQNKL